MKSILFQFVIMAVVALVFAMTAIQSYWNHADTREKFDRISELLVNPEARPDAWTKTMDDERTKQLCKAILFRIQHNTSKVVMDTQLPEVCK